MTRSLMVWGSSSGAGKSLLATALCRWAAQRGIDVAPFKAQNMSNNARVVPGPDGGFGEIGAAQYFQALAARVPPTVDMNPVLLKPARDTASQVVLQGRVADDLSRLPWRERSAHLATAACESFGRLHAQHELLVLEGAGSPAEINLAADDYVNLGTARWAQAAGAFKSLIVTDIDRGGAFAHLYGTWALLPDDLKPTLAGFVLNKFRGDAALLAPGPERLQQLTGVPIVGVLPMQRDHGLPDEDGVFDAAAAATGDGEAPHQRVAVVAYPRISNLDEFQPLRQVPGLWLTWARHAAELEAVDWIILPGSKQVSGDLHWLRERGLDAAIARHAAQGKQVLGVCGGLQMLGHLAERSARPGRRAGPRAGSRPAAAERALCRAQARAGRAGALRRFAAALAGAGRHRHPAYKIRTGITEPVDALPGAALATALRDGHGTVIGWQRGPVLGVYAHGLFESAAVMRALFGAEVVTLDASLDRLADLVDGHFEPGVLNRCLRA